MTKLILPALMFAAIVLPFSTFASSKLQVSSKSDFSISDDNFSPGQTVYVKIDASNSGNDKSVLNVRDSSYNILNIYTFSRSGSTFSTGFPAPNSEGYYSLEAQIKSEGSSNVSVKTIKVGNPGSANIKVSVNESIKGTRNQSQSQSEKSESEESESEESQSQSDSQEGAPELENGQTDNESDNIELESNSDDNSIFRSIGSLVVRFAAFVWPF